MQSTSSIFNASRTLARPASRQVLRSYLQQAALGARFSSLVRPSTLTQDSSPIQLNKRAQLRAIQSSAILSYSLADPATTSSVQEPQQSGQAAPPAEISTEEYHQRADIFMDELVAKLEDLQEQRDDLEVDYSAGVLTVSFPPAGTYILNKQPPNKQIWLSSPISGPKRYDWVRLSESMQDKEGTGVGDWVYLRDGSTLTDLVRKELGVAIGFDEGTV